MSALLNRARAIEVMERFGLDGLVAHLPINTYYLSGYWGLLNTPVGFDGTYFAVLSRQVERPVILILPAFERGRYDAQQAPAVRMNAGDSGPTLIAYDHQAPMGEGVGAFNSLADALRELGLDAATLGSDDARVSLWLNEAGFDRADVRYCPDVFREVRLIKTPAEIELMREAARINELALMLAADSLRAGATPAEIEDLYMLAMAQQGGRGVYLLVGGMAGPAGGSVAPGQPLALDALGHYRHYHGDFGRTAVVGEPPRQLKSTYARLLVGWEAARENLRPGTCYSEVAEAVGAAVRAAGLPDFANPVVHSLGLEHTDDPRPAGVLPWQKPDRVLEPNMVVNVDMPHTVAGWGTVHMEDTVRITTYGHERLGKADTLLRVIDAEM